MHKHKANRHTYDVGAAHNDAILATNFDAGTLDKLDAASGSARECGWLTTLERELADVLGKESINILREVNTVENGVLADVIR